MGMSSPSPSKEQLKSPSKEGAVDSGKSEALAPSVDFKQNYVGVTHRKRRGKFQARIYKMNKEYNIGLFDLATDAAFAYDAAYRMFGLKLAQKKTPSSPPKNDGKADPFESEEANFVFNWLTYSDDDMMDVEAPERMNFTCPSNYRERRSEELAARMMAKSQDQSDEGLKEMIISEAVLVAKVRKEIISIAKLAAAICPVQRLFGKRACDLLFEELPEVEVRNRKRSRKPSRDYLVKHQYVQEPQQQVPPQEQPPNPVSNGALQQMLLQQQMYGQAQAMMGSRMGYGNMFGGLPCIGPSPPTNNGFLGYPRERAMMPDDSLSPSLPAVNPSLPPSGSTLDPQLWYLMMQQQQNIPHSNMLSMNDQLRNIPRQADLPPQGPPVEMPFTKQEQPSAFPAQPVNINQTLPSGESSSSAPAPAPAPEK